MGILRNDADEIRVSADQPTRLLVIAGRPLNEPIASYGPFVMNTSEQIQEAFADYQAGYFERVQVAKL
jgi:redox-sensitive bicupin YhaK (pirin superfamily)